MPERHEAGDHQLDERELISLAQNGDAEAFGGLYEQFAPVIFRFVRAHLDDRLDAEDLTEEVFLRVWRSLPNYRDNGVPFVAYLFRVARNAIIDFYRRSKQERGQVSLDDTPLPDHRPDPGDIVAANIEHKELSKTLTLLREDYRTVLALRFLSDLSPEETGQAMGKSAGAVRVLQHRALISLRKLLGS